MNKITGNVEFCSLVLSRITIYDIVFVLAKAVFRYCHEFSLFV